MGVKGKGGRPRLGKTKRLNVTARPEFHDAVLEAAKQRGMTIGEFVTEVLAKELGTIDDQQQVA